MKKFINSKYNISGFLFVLSLLFNSNFSYGDWTRKNAGHGNYWVSNGLVLQIEAGNEVEGLNVNFTVRHTPFPNNLGIPSIESLEKAGIIRSTAFIMTAHDNLTHFPVEAWGNRYHSKSAEEADKIINTLTLDENERAQMKLEVQNRFALQSKWAASRILNAPAKFAASLKEVVAMYPNEVPIALANGQKRIGSQKMESVYTEKSVVQATLLHLKNIYAGERPSAERYLETLDTISKQTSSASSAK